MFRVAPSLIAGLLLAGVAAATPAPFDGMVPVGPHRLQVHVEGAGTPAIVIDTGLADQLERLRPLHARLASFTKVVAYNRAGYGGSGEGPLPRDAAREARELHTLLEKASVPAPYVLLGHSLGGLNAQIFASLYPEDVAGIVLLDPPPLTFILRKDFASLSGMADRMTAEWQAIADAPVDPENAEGRARGVFFRMLASEHREMFGTSAKQVEAVRSFGDIPLVVIGSGKANPAFGDTAEAFQRYWIEQSRALSARSSRGRFVLAEDATHHIYMDAPDLVVEAARAVIGEARTRTKK